LIEAAEKSVGSHHSKPYRLRIKYLCEDLDVLRRRVKGLARDIERKLDDHQVGKLLTTIDGVGPLTAACLIAELGDPARFRSPGANRELCRRCAAAPAIGQEAVFRHSNNSVRKCSLAEGTLDGGSQRRPLQSVATSVL
jgi:transposase